MTQKVNELIRIKIFLKDFGEISVTIKTIQYCKKIYGLSLL